MVGSKESARRSKGNECYSFCGCYFENKISDFSIRLVVQRQYHCFKLIKKNTDTSPSHYCMTRILELICRSEMIRNDFFNYDSVAIIESLYNY